MHFVKMHGIGNDYVYINGFADHEAVSAACDPALLARRIADRHTGVGGDGLILVLPPDPGVDADVRMRMFNADGSEAEMCGNGIRCVCKLAHDHNSTSANPMRVQTAIGVLALEYTTNSDGRVDQVTVDMGEPVLEPSAIPVNIKQLTQVVNHTTHDLIEWPPPADWVGPVGLDERMTCVSMGNPHVVMYCDDVAGVPLECIGPIVEHHPAFPQRINVHFVKVNDKTEVTMRTWERGSGITQACGTGASAVCVAGVLTARNGRTITAHLPGGDLQLEWREADNHVYMTGPAAEVFAGEWPDF